VTRARERAYARMEGQRERPTILYPLMIVGLLGPLYAPWIVAAVQAIRRLL